MKRLYASSGDRRRLYGGNLQGRSKKEEVGKAIYRIRNTGKRLLNFFPSYFYVLNLVASIIPRLRRLFFAGVCETCNPDRLLGSPDTPQSPAAPAMSARP